MTVLQPGPELLGVILLALQRHLGLFDLSLSLLFALLRLFEGAN